MKVKEIKEILLNKDFRTNFYLESDYLHKIVENRENRNIPEIVDLLKQISEVYPDSINISINKIEGDLILISIKGDSIIPTNLLEITRILDLLHFLEKEIMDLELKNKNFGGDFLALLEKCRILLDNK